MEKTTVVWTNHWAKGLISVVGQVQDETITQTWEMTLLSSQTEETQSSFSDLLQTQAGHHVKTIESLELTIKANPKVIQRFKTFNNNEEQIGL